jgi:thiamine-phosphate pyrophosphorylase
MNAPSRATGLRGLYLLTPDEPDTGRLLARVGAVIGDAVLLQYRNKSADFDSRREQALALRALCVEAAVPLIVNDDVALARAVGADGVHLGEHDDDLDRARALLGHDAIIGVSCYDDIERARDAAKRGADYVAFGAFQPSSTKPGARRATPALLRQAAALRLPRVAIGGIRPEHAPELVRAGADLLAVIAGVFDAPDPAAAARMYRASFQDSIATGAPSTSAA